jgi:signal peptide peptidase SppA
MRYERILAEFHGRAWALPESLLLRMQEVLSAQASGVKWDAEEIRERIAASNILSGYEGRECLGFRYSALHGASSQGRGSRTSGKVGIIPITGIISHRMNLVSEISGPTGGTSIQKLKAQFRECMRLEDCKAIVLDVDSPGGCVDGVPEFADEIYEARKQKPVIAVCNSMACSAAYWLASSASEVVCTPSGQCGSIGVYMMHLDESESLKRQGLKITLIKAGKFKGEGNSTEPLSDDARAAAQTNVDAFYSMFVRSVARNRGTSQAAVREGYGQGRTVMAAQAAKQDLVDRVVTFDDILGEMLSGATPSRRVLSGSSSSSRAFDSNPNLQRRQRQLDLEGGRSSAASPNPDDEEDQACSCNCVACQDCENKTGNARADDMSCQCDCQACKACEFKTASAKASESNPNVERRRRQLSLEGGRSMPRASHPSIRTLQRRLDLQR